MRARVVRLTAEGCCEARTENDLLVVFSLASDCDVHPNDLLEFDNLKMDSSVAVRNSARDNSFNVHIAAKNVHDLRLMPAHGSSRTPSEERLLGR